MGVGTESLELVGPETLCLPSEMDGIASALAIDHFKCYAARPPAGPGSPASPRSIVVELEDEFASSTAAVTETRLFCAPVDKNGEGILEDVPGNHLTCYEYNVPGVIPEGTLYLPNQFHDDMSFTKVEGPPSLLCMPTEKVEVRLP